MKKIFNKVSFAALALAASMTISSCEDFLETTPYDFTAPETFYKTENDCKMALAGIYWTLVREPVYGAKYSCLISNIDDLSYYQRNEGALAGQVFGNAHNPSNNDIWLTWEELYKGINNANMLIENIDKAEMADETKTRMKGEAKFLRAYYHFLLAQAYYEVPMRKESFKDVSKSSMEATSHKEAIEWIIQEMKDCVNMVDDSKYDKSPSYVKKNTVMGVLSRVYLWHAGEFCQGGQESYKQAAYWAHEVVKSNKHKLNPDVFKMWQCMASDTYDTEFNESIWEAEFFGNREGDGLGNYTDGRIGNVIGNLQQCATNPGPGYSYGFFAPTLILWDLYQKNEGDKRRDLSIATYKIDKNAKKVDWNENQIVQRHCGKFRREWEPSKMKQKSYTPENYPILRYADVLLMWSEGALESGQGVAEAIKGINEVRKRAGIPALSASISEAELRQEIRDERARELCFESLRKYDLVRWGIYVKAIHDDLGARTSNQGSKPGQWPTGNNFKSADVYAKNTTEKHQFLPIPTTELDVNTKLEQNKFWK